MPLCSSDQSTILETRKHGTSMYHMCHFRESRMKMTLKSLKEKKNELTLRKGLSPDDPTLIIHTDEGL
jgi:predicted DNA-binding protein (MmcQ/YjbR family)